MKRLLLSLFIICAGEILDRFLVWGFSDFGLREGIAVASDWMNAKKGDLSNLVGRLLIEELYLYKLNASLCK